jgi:hypothetical protein
MGRSHTGPRENQGLFRIANERLAERVREFDRDEFPIPFLCECADDACLGRIDLVRSRYEEIRSEPNRYVVLPGHAMIETERVVEDSGDFHVIERERDGYE